MAFREITTASKVPRRLVAAVDGPEKVGKTHLSLTAPRPIYHFNFDVGTEGVIEKFAGPELFQADFRIDRTLPVNDAAAVHTKIHDQFVKDYEAALTAIKKAGHGTAIIDTHTEQNETLRLKHFGKLQNVMPHHYGPVNAAQRELIRLALDTPQANVIFICRMQDEYVNDKATGRLKRSGWNQLGGQVQINLSCSYSGGEFAVTIDNCRQNPTANGQVLSGPMFNWDFLLMLVHGEAP
jgi:hypothetical protein